MFSERFFLVLCIYGQVKDALPIGARRRQRRIYRACFILKWCWIEGQTHRPWLPYWSNRNSAAATGLYTLWSFIFPLTRWMTKQMNAIAMSGLSLASALLDISLMVSTILILLHRSKDLSISTVMTLAPREIIFLLQEEYICSEECFSLCHRVEIFMTLLQALFYVWFSNWPKSIARVWLHHHISPELWYPVKRCQRHWQNRKKKTKQFLKIFFPRSHHE